MPSMARVVAVVCIGVVSFSPASALVVLANRFERAALVLRTAGQRFGSDDLLQLGAEVRQPDELKQVKKMITHMIAQHQAAQAEDTSHKAFCDKEMLASKAKVEKLKRELEKRTADKDLHTAQLAEIKDNIGDLHEEIATAQKDKVKAAKLREDEATAYEKKTRAWDETLAALRTKLRTDSEKVRKAVQKEQEELMLKKVHAEDKEQDAQIKYKNLDEDLAEALKKKTKAVELKQRKVISMEHELSLADGDFKSAQEEMAAAKDYQEKVKTSCIVRQDPAQERRKSRNNQIASLKEAYGILSGDDIAV